MRPDVLGASVGQARPGARPPPARRPPGLRAGGPPAGVPGPPGPAGRDGQDGRGLTYRGVHVPGQAYAPGDLVTAGGSAWYCHAPTTTAPGAGPDWQLMVKRGRDARGDRS